jgi:hypothetical protein
VCVCQVQVEKAFNHDRIKNDLPPTEFPGKRRTLDPTLFSKQNQGPMLWFLIYFRQIKLRKDWRFWFKTKPNYAKFWSQHLFSRKTPICTPKIVENRKKLWS